MPRLEYRPRSRVKFESNWLISCASNVTSQIGQDGIIAKIFAVIGETNKVCLELGAWDGKYLSNTWNLIENKGWNGVLIEADEVKFREIAINHSSDRVNALNLHVSLTGANSIDCIMSNYGQIEPDFVSIDIDGNDWHVWASMRRIKPRVVLVEFNPTIPNDVYFVQDADFSVFQGSSLLAFIELAHLQGYSLVCVDQWDAFFVRKELYHKFNIQDNDIDSMFEPIYQTKIFQCFDGRMYNVGHQTLLWKGVTFDSCSLQVLPTEQQVYSSGPNQNTRTW